METTASLRYLRQSPQKVRLLADLIRGRSVEDASTILSLSSKKAAKSLGKLLQSAVANAESRDDAVDIDRLFISEVQVNGGPSLKRIRPQPMGRAFRILKRTSHVTIKLDTRKGEA